MFYDLVLLRRQNHGRFAMAWVASTRGIKTVIKEFGIKKIRDIDISALCQETTDYLISNSNNPKERFSLRMAVHLLEGTIIIFAKKVAIFQDDLHRDFTILFTIPKDLSLPARKKGPTQRIFKTPPTPIVGEKIKRKKPREESLLEEFPKDVLEQEEINILLISPEEMRARQEELSILELQPLQVALPDEIFGELDVGPTSDAPQWIVPPKPPSERSEKSQFDKIVEQLIEEDKAKKTEVAERKKSSSSSSVVEGPRTIQVEAVVHEEGGVDRSEKGESQKGSSSNGVQVGPSVIVTEAMVHRSAEEEAEIIEQLPRPSFVLESMEVEIPIAKEPEGASEKDKIDGVKEKQKVKKKAPLRQLQTDEIPTPDSVVSRKLTRADEERMEKEAKIAKYLRLKFKIPKKVVQLNEYTKMASLVADLPITIFQDRDLITSLLMDFLIIIPEVQLENEEIRMEQMRHGGSVSSQNSDLLKHPGSTMTPVEGPSKSSSHLLSEPPRMLGSVEFMREFDKETLRSTPLRETVELPQKRLYSETRIEYEIPVRETADRREEQLIDIEPFLPEGVGEELPRGSPKRKSASIEKLENENNTRDILMKVKNWDETEGYILVDDLIPEPKNRSNAAKTFFLLLSLAKEEFIVVIPEDNSLEAKFVRRGRKLL